jgi:hypothetical protein
VNCEVSTRLISSVFNVWRDGCQECVTKSVSFTNQLSLLVNGGTSGCVYDTHSVQLQWLQDPCEINGFNLSNVRHEASRYYRNKERE